MKEIAKIQETFKLTIKSSGFTYEDISNKLNLSVATIKRLLNGKDISISKLVNLSEALGVNFFDIIEQAQSAEAKIYNFTLGQENILASEFKTFLVLRLILLNSDFKEIMDRLKLTKLELQTILINLEKEKLIELWPNDKIKPLAHFPFKWIDQGPLERTYKKNILSKISKEFDNIGINKRIQTNRSQSIIKELLLSSKEVDQINIDFQGLLKKYSYLSSLRMKNKKKGANIFSLFLISGEFSLWD